MEYRERVEAICKARGFDLIEATVEIAMDPDSEHRMAAMRIVHDHAYPRLKALEVEQSGGVEVRITDATRRPAESADPDDVDPLS